MSNAYPKRKSYIKRRRKFGFLARMKSYRGRRLINRKRSLGRRVNVRAKF